MKSGKIPLELIMLIMDIWKIMICSCDINVPPLVVLEKKMYLLVLVISPPFLKEKEVLMTINILKFKLNFNTTGIATTANRHP